MGSVKATTILTNTDISDTEPMIEGRFIIEDRWSVKGSSIYYNVLVKWDSYPYDTAKNNLPYHTSALHLVT
jgi:hypothetical protein